MSDDKPVRAITAPVWAAGRGITSPSLPAEANSKGAARVIYAGPNWAPGEQGPAFLHVSAWFDQPVRIYFAPSASPGRSPVQPATSAKTLDVGPGQADFDIPRGTTLMASTFPVGGAGKSSTETAILVRPTGAYCASRHNHHERGDVNGGAAITFISAPQGCLEYWFSATVDGTWLLLDTLGNAVGAPNVYTAAVDGVIYVGPLAGGWQFQFTNTTAGAGAVGVRGTVEV